MENLKCFKNIDINIIKSFFRVNSNGSVPDPVNLHLDRFFIHFFSGISPTPLAQKNQEYQQILVYSLHETGDSGLLSP